MNPTQELEHVTTGAPMVSMDPSVAPDSGILTNTQVPSINRVLNPTAIAFNNPAGTGAAFDKKDAVYGIYSRWPEKNTTVNGSLQQGSELIRISLNPNSYPPKLKDWVNFHRSCIPALDVSIVIGGAAGTISWLALGWIPDDSQVTVTLDDLQQVACEHMNMNNTTTLSFILNDNRYAGMYRKLPLDTEPYPAMVLMVNHPALNVQRNDDVNYPIDVYVRFAPHALFMEPYNVISVDPNLITSLDLFPYFKITDLDLLIGTSSVSNRFQNVTYFPDCGWNTAQFNPQYFHENLCGMSCVSENFFFVYGEEKDIDLATWQRFYSIFGPNGTNQLEPRQYPEYLSFAYGFVPTDYANIMTFDIFPQLRSTQYSIPKITIRSNGISYSTTQIHVFEFGCILVFFANLIKHTGYTPRVVYQHFEENIIAFDNDFTHGDSPPVVTLHILPGSDPLEAIPEDGIYTFKPPEKITDVVMEKPFFPLNRLYNFTYIQTGNTTGSSRMPVGLSTISVVRSGTTCTTDSDTAFHPILAPDLTSARTILDGVLKRLQTQWIAFELLVNGTNYGTVVYSDGVLGVRTNMIRRILTGISAHVVLSEIRATSNPSAIPAFSTRQFVPWTNKFSNEIPRFSLPILERQSFAGASAVASGLGGLFGGLASHLEKQTERKWLERYLQLQFTGQNSLQNLRNQGLMDLENQRLENQMKILGISSVSAQQGNYLDNTNSSSISTQTNPTTRFQTSNIATQTQRNAPLHPVVNNSFNSFPPTYQSLITQPNKSFLYSPSQIEARKPTPNNSFLHSEGTKYKTTTTNSNDHIPKTSLAPDIGQFPVSGAQVKNTSFLHNRSNNIRQYANPSTLHGPPSASQDRINMELINEEMDTVLPPSNPIIPKPNYSDPNETSMMLG